MLETKWFQNLFIVFMLLVIAGLLLWGWGHGTRAAKSKTIIKDAEILTQGFGYFHEDQNRYPTTGEFEDDNIMRAYIAGYPPQNFITELCPKTYDYFSKSPQMYELRICLPKAVSGYVQGWNTLKNNEQ